MEYLIIYFPNILASLMAALSLALLGSQLAARSESLQAFVVSQSAALGITIGMAALLIMTGTITLSLVVPAMSAFFFAVLIYFVSQNLCKKNRVKATEILVVTFLFTIALNYLITAALPSLEQHFSAAFMGDIATASKGSSYWLLLVSVLGGLFLALNYKKLLFQSFWVSSSELTYFPKLNILFYLIGAILIVESTRIFGFLFTTSSLLTLPLGASLASKSLKLYTNNLLLLSFLSTLSGFLLSLTFQMLSTSASIVLCQVLGSITLILVLKLEEGKTQ